MMEHTTDRLFWTLTSVIVGALLLTIGINAFPEATQAIIHPISGILKQADTTTDTANKVANNIINYDPDAKFKAHAIEASTLGYDIKNNGDGTCTITKYRYNNNYNINIPSYIKDNGQLLKITNIGAWAFSNHKLTSVSIPNSVINIDDGAFNTNNLTSITIPNSVKTIGAWSFEFNKLVSVNISNSLTNIETGAFNSNNITSLTIPSSVKTIGAWSFEFNNLKSVIIPNSVTNIGKGAFFNNKLASINIPNNQTYQSIPSKFAFDSDVTVTNRS